MPSEQNKLCSPVLQMLSPAKINLFLEVIRRRDDGYHELETVMTRISLFDEMAFELRENEISLELACDPSIDAALLPKTSDNLVYNTLNCLRQISGVTSGMGVKLYKRIPIQAGLGGASSNAATALIAANRIWGLNWPVDQLNSVAKHLGSDISYFLYPGTAVCSGRGELVTPIYNVGYGVPIVVLKPPVGFSTKQVFQEIELAKDPIQSGVFLDALRHGGTERVAQAMFNRFTKTTNKLSRWGTRLSGELEREGALASQVSGSGSCYFGMFGNAKRARVAARTIESRWPEVKAYVCHTISGSTYPDINGSE